MLSKVIFTAAIATNVSAGLFDSLADKLGDVSDLIDPAEDIINDLSDIQLPSGIDL